MKNSFFTIIVIGVFTLSTQAQSYTNPIHFVQEILYNRTVSKFDDLSEELKRRSAINDSINNTLLSLREMKRQKVSSMSSVPQYYTDPVRLKRFKEKAETTRNILNYSKKIMQKQEKFHYFEEVIKKLEDELEVVESNWQIVTEFEGDKKLMNAHQRYKIALYAEEGLKNISRDAINYSRIAYALTRSPESAVEDNKQILNDILKSQKGIE